MALFPEIMLPPGNIVVADVGAADEVVPGSTKVLPKYVLNLTFCDDERYTSTNFISSGNLVLTCEIPYSKIGWSKITSILINLENFTFIINEYKHIYTIG